MFSKDIYIQRRRILASRIGKGIILLPGNREQGMNYRDNHYPFRQDSTFLYYTGIDLPDLVFVMDLDGGKEYVYGEEQSLEDTVWTGPLPSLLSMAEKSGVGQVRCISSLKDALKGGSAIHYLPPYRADVHLLLQSWGISEKPSVELIQAVVLQRSYKQAEEVIQIEQAIGVSVAMQRKAMELARPGIRESEIAAQLQAIAVSEGGNLAFPTILTVNGQFLHNHASHQVLQNGQMVLCDCGAENQMHYAGDLTRTFPVSGVFTSRQKEIYNIVLNAHESAIAALKPGILFKEVHLLACEQLASGLKAIGLMKGDPKEAVAQGAHALFFQCGLGHMMGLDVHDMENLGEQYVGYTPDLQKSTEFGLKSLRFGRALEPDFVLTVEPGIYFIPQLIEEWKATGKYSDFINYEAVEAYKDFGGIRVEEDFLITSNGSRLLGTPLSKRIEEIES
ncbi:Xaa-Pro aminopeptidase [Pedobacter sp. HMWF019]|uniref:aminopeptidase P family protein n=1 Tax=Pedobacter sp. HMWF019 TaxID=2056856 RepID=UPI000D389E93|nr:aminopeptidase P family protein [Pedobacter sp. HMWF019]PTS95879.1 Xaa-Pro aminopeptidase [Pedobacter sp. HMWF019]